MANETTAKIRNPRGIRFNVNSPDLFPPITLGASVASTTIQGRYVLPCTSKLVGVVSYASAVGATLPLGNLFNIVVGEGAYQTGTTGVPASATLTVASPHTGDLITINFGGASFQYQVLSTDTTATILANSICRAWQIQQLVPEYSLTPPLNKAIYSPLAAFSPYLGFGLNRVLGAWNSAGAGAIVFTTLSTGTALNGQTITASVSGSGATTTITASAALSGGANSTGITTPTNNTVLYNGVYSFASIGQALFANDQAISGPAPGNYGVFYEPTGWDALLPQGANLTLRATTGAGASVTNWNVAVIVVPYDPKPNIPQDTIASTPGATFSPARVIF
jgi:hypothetical protein